MYCYEDGCVVFLINNMFYSAHWENSLSTILLVSFSCWPLGYKRNMAFCFSLGKPSFWEWSWMNGIFLIILPSVFIFITELSLIFLILRKYQRDNCVCIGQKLSKFGASHFFCYANLWLYICMLIKSISAKTWL